MATSDHVEVRAGAYADSVTLLQVSRRVGDVAGVESAMVAMATELNLEMIAGMGFAVEGADPNAMVIAIRAEPQALDVALAEVDAALADRPAAASRRRDDAPVARTVAQAARRPASLVIVSTPGEAAFAEASDALDAGLPVMIFSDNVPVDQEVTLKARAAEQGLLVMGPDAGTAIIGGVGLGFANVVSPGPVGIVAASGTGAQHVASLLDDAGVGISHVLGVGGRDLSGDIGGAGALLALRALDDDPATELIVLLSKPPDGEVVTRLRQLVAGLGTPVLEAFVTAEGDDLTALAGQVAARFGARVVPPVWRADRRAEVGTATEIRGLFAGGTLCDEAMAITLRRLGGQAPIRSNIAFGPIGPLTDGLDTPGHVFVDLGDDEYTRGRPHPMIDQRLRVARLAAEAQRPGSRVVLVDVVLGHGAHPDPAAELAPAIVDAQRVNPSLSVVVSLCGTRSDPQGRDRQASALMAAGADVAASNAGATRIALERLEDAS